MSVKHRLAADAQSEEATQPHVTGAHRRRTRAATDVTSAPIDPPPALPCPICECWLMYQYTVTGGLKPVERWDYLSCRSCGTFVYRHRTRSLRRDAIVA